MSGRVNKGVTVRCAAKLDSPKPRMSPKVLKNIFKIAKKTSPNETALALQKTNQTSKISVPTQPGRLSQKFPKSVDQSELERQKKAKISEKNSKKLKIVVKKIKFCSVTLKLLAPEEVYIINECTSALSCFWLKKGTKKGPTTKFC